jgi:hypothetical protein
VLGQAVFNASNCGGPFSDIDGCDLTHQLAVQGAVDISAATVQGQTALLLRSDTPNVLQVQNQQGSTVLFTMVGQSPGQATLTAYNSSGDVDHLTITVADIGSIDYSTVSSGSGTFTLGNGGDIDGTYVLNSGVQDFSLLFLQIDPTATQMLGRSDFTYQLDPGLNFQSGKDQPDSLEFDLVRPTQTGTYALLITAKAGPGRFKMEITAN